MFAEPRRGLWSPPALLTLPALLTPSALLTHLARWAPPAPPLAMTASCLPTPALPGQVRAVGSAGGHTAVRHRLRTGPSLLGDQLPSQPGRARAPAWSFGATLPIASALRFSDVVSVEPGSACWVPVDASSGFPIENLPYGAFTPADGDSPRIGARIGDFVVDLAAVLGDDVFARPSLNGFMAKGRAAWHEARRRLTELLRDESAKTAVEPHLHRIETVRLHLPFEVADYVDFYASEHHAANVGRLFRPDSEPLPAAWKHLPIGYHGRAGTVIVSGTPVRRPSGLRRPSGEPSASYGASGRLDVECEVGFVVGAGSEMGVAVPISRFADHVFGLVLVNDWSARDIQAFEYVPLGPFLGKSFATSVSAWVIPLDALEAARVASPPQAPEPAAYLCAADPWGFDLALEVEWNGTVVSRPPFSEMYWSAAQQLAHLTVNGASLRTGDLFASGTVSGPAPGERGSFLELSWNGTSPVLLDDGSKRSFLHDGDSVTIRGTAPGLGGRPISLGEVSGTIVPAGGTP